MCCGDQIENGTSVHNNNKKGGKRWEKTTEPHTILSKAEVYWVLFYTILPSYYSNNVKEGFIILYNTEMTEDRNLLVPPTAEIPPPLDTTNLVISPMTPPHHHADEPVPPPPADQHLVICWTKFITLNIRVLVITIINIYYFFHLRNRSLLLVLGQAL